MKKEKNTKQQLFEMMDKVTGMQLNEDIFNTPEMGDINKSGYIAGYDPNKFPQGQNIKEDRYILNKDEFIKNLSKEKVDEETIMWLSKEFNYEPELIKTIAERNKYNPIETYNEVVVYRYN